MTNNNNITCYKQTGNGFLSPPHTIASPTHPITPPTHPIPPPHHIPSAGDSYGRSAGDYYGRLAGCYFGLSTGIFLYIFCAKHYILYPYTHTNITYII